MASDQDRFDAAYEAFRDLSKHLYDIDTRQYARGVTSDDAPGVKLDDGQVKLRELVRLPRNWPLARLTIPLGGLSKQIDRLLEGYYFQIPTATRMHTMERLSRPPRTTIDPAEYHPTNTTPSLFASSPLRAVHLGPSGVDVIHPSSTLHLFPGPSI